MGTFTIRDETKFDGAFVSRFFFGSLQFCELTILNADFFFQGHFKVILCFVSGMLDFSFRETK